MASHPNCYLLLSKAFYPTNQNSACIVPFPFQCHHFRFKFYRRFLAFWGLLGMPCLGSEERLNFIFTSQNRRNTIGMAARRGKVGMRRKEPRRDAIRIPRPPQVLFVAISFHQNGHLWTGV